MYEDLPKNKVQELFSELLYGDTPYGWSIAGPKENIKNMKREDFVNYRKSHYVAGKTAVVIAGDIDANDTFNKVEKAFKNIASGKVIPKIKILEKQSKPEIKIKHKDTDQTHIVIGVRSFRASDKRMSTLRVLSTILGGGMSSRLFQKMREELGICYYVKSETDEFTNHGSLRISAGVDKTRLKEAVVGILGEIEKIRDEKVSEEELKKTKDYMIGNMYLGLESSDSLVGFYGFQEIMKEKIKTPKEVEKQIMKVTTKDIQKLAKDLFKNSSLNMAIVGNLENKEQFKKIFKL